jgi:hypothetical protein
LQNGYHSFLQLVEDIFNYQDQLARLADRCLKYEEEDGYAGYQVKQSIEGGAGLIFSGSGWARASYFRLGLFGA